MLLLGEDEKINKIKTWRKCCTWVLSSLQSGSHLWFLWWLEYEYRLYFRGDYDVLSCLIIMLSVGDCKDDTWVAIFESNGRRMSRELKYIKTIRYFSEFKCIIQTNRLVLCAILVMLFLNIMCSRPIRRIVWAKGSPFFVISFFIPHNLFSYQSQGVQKHFVFCWLPREPHCHLSCLVSSPKVNELSDWITLCM